MATNETATAPATHTTLPLQVNRLAREMDDAATEGDEPWGTPPIYTPTYYSDDIEDANDPASHPIAQYQVARKYGFHSALVPWKARKSNPVTDLITIRRVLNDFRPTKATFTYDEISEKMSATDETGIARPRMLHPLMATLGSWPYESGNTTRWINPLYCHHPSEPYPTLSDSSSLGETVLEERRKQWVQWGLSVNLPMELIAARMNWSRETCWRQGWPIAEWREMGKRMFARTLKTTAAWGVPKTRIARAYGLERDESGRKSTVNYWINTYASEFEPPPYNHVIRE